jgi:hypothetical protein
MHLPWLWTHFCFRGLWEDEMFARQVLPQASSKSVWIQTKGALLRAPLDGRT